MTIQRILDKARTIESRISRALSRAAEDAAGPEAREPLQIAYAIVDAVERQIQPGSRGTRLFPFNRVAVTVLAPTREARARIEALFGARPTLQDRVVDRLRSAGCDAGDLRVEIGYAGKVARSWENPHFGVTFDRVEPAPAESPTPVETTASRLEIAIVRGVAERRTYSLAMPRIDLGRGAEVRDSRHRLLRTNHVAFVEGSGAENQTVSRRHAHILVDAGEHRLHDDRSEHGTGIVRGGRTIPVPAGSRGVRLKSGDEIALGEARLRVRIAESG